MTEILIHTSEPEVYMYILRLLQSGPKDTDTLTSELVSAGYIPENYRGKRISAGNRISGLLRAGLIGKNELEMYELTEKALQNEITITDEKRDNQGLKMLILELLREAALTLDQLVTYLDGCFDDEVTAPAILVQAALRLLQTEGKVSPSKDIDNQKVWQIVASNSSTTKSVKRLTFKLD